MTDLPDVFCQVSVDPLVGTFLNRDGLNVS